MVSTAGVLIADNHWSALFAGRRRFLTAGILVLELGTALQVYVFTMVMPDVARDLGNVQLYGSAFTVFSAAGVAGMALTGMLSDRRGVTIALTLMTLLLAAGSLLAAGAGSMQVLVVARMVQGVGAGGLEMLPYAVLGKAYPAEQRPQLLTLLSLPWLVAGLAGPLYAAEVTSIAANGWRLAIATSLPLAVVALVLMLAVPLPAASRPAGQRRRLAPVRDRRALGASVACATLLCLVIFTVEAFFPLLLTQVRSRPVAEAAALLAASAATWSIGTWSTTRFWTSAPRSAVIAWSAAGITVCVAGLLAGLWQAPLLVVDAAVLLYGYMAGVAYPVIMDVTIESAGPGREGTATAAAFIGQNIGTALGTGVGTVSIAISATTVSVGFALRAPLVACVVAGTGCALLAALVGFDRQGSDQPAGQPAVDVKGAGNAD